MIRRTRATRSTRQGLANGLVVLSISLISLLSGCASTRGMMTFRYRDPMSGAPRLQHASNPQKDELIAHLNRNVDRVQSWRANSVRIYANNWTLSGRLAVEKGRHVRLVVTSPLGNELDMGSNEDRFWVWSKRMEPAFVTCKHENIEAARQVLGIPFEPDWLMVAFGVMPIPSDGVSMQVDLADQKARLVQQVMSAHGRPLRRTILVDLRKAKAVVVEHGLYDHYGKPLALAKLKNHQVDRESGVVLPHRVELEMPDAQMHMSMDMGKIQINPASIPSQIWAMPEFPGYEVVNLDTEMPKVRATSSVHLDQIEDSHAEDSQEDASSDDVEDSRPPREKPGLSRLPNEEEESTAVTDHDWSE